MERSTSKLAFGKYFTGCLQIPTSVLSLQPKMSFLLPAHSTWQEGIPDSDPFSNKGLLILMVMVTEKNQLHGDQNPVPRVSFSETSPHWRGLTKNFLVFPNFDSNRRHLHLSPFNLLVTTQVCPACQACERYLCFQNPCD